MEPQPTTAQPRVRIQTEDFDLSTEVAALHAADTRVGAVCAFVGLVREWAPTLVAGAPALPPEGALASLGRPGAGEGRAPTLAPSGAALPPEGALASLGRPGAGEGRTPTLAPSGAALPPEGALASLGRPGAGSEAPTPVADAPAFMELEHYPGMTERAIEAMIEQAQRRFEIYGARVLHRVGRLGLGEQIVLVAVTAAHRGQAFAACEFLMDYLKTQAPFWKKEHSAAGARWVDARASDDAALAKWGIEADNAA